MAIALDEHGASMAGAATGFIVAFGLFFACLALGTLAMRAGRSA